MSETALLLAQAGMTACLAGWMIVAAADNWIHPKFNEEAVAMVMRFDRMRESYPEDYAHIAYRRIDDPRLIRLAFRAIVLWESLAALLLTVGALALLGALLGLVPAETARGIAILGALAFTANWAGFLIGGNWFCYWYCHVEGQATHFKLALWGSVAMVLIAIA